MAGVRTDPRREEKVADLRLNRTLAQGNPKSAPRRRLGGENAVSAQGSENIWADSPFSWSDRDWNPLRLLYESVC